MGQAHGRTILHTYDAQGRPYRTIYKGTVQSPDVYTQNNYSCCVLSSTVDENGNETHYAYDDLNRVTKTWTGISGQEEAHPLVEYTYDNFGNRKTVKTLTSAQGSQRTTTFTYDDLNRVTKIEYPSGIVGDEEFGYNDIGHQVWKKDGNDDYTYYKYDTHNRLTDVYWDAGEPSDPIQYPTGDGDVHYHYLDHTDLKTLMADDSGTSEYTYDFQGRLDHYTPPQGLSSGYYIGYDYNNAGQKTSVRITNGTTTPFSVYYNYFANGWLKDVRLGSSNGTLVAEYEYDSVGNRTQALYGNNTYQTFGYEASDPRWRLDNIHYFYKCDTQIEDQGGLKFTRDDAGNPMRWGNLDGKYTRVYSYDENSRLKTVNLPGNPHVVHSYDWVGNRQDTGFSYNAADQLVSRPEHTYEYYSDGSLHYQKDASGNVQQTHSYTFDGLLSSVAHSVGGTSSMTWDADQNRISFTSSTDQTHPYTFVYDVTAGIPAVIQESHNGTSVYYVREPGGELLARVSGSDTKYYHFDDLGSALYLTAADGTVSDKYAYDAWGNVTNHTGVTEQPYQYVGQLGYYTHYQDENMSGLLQLGVRYYSSDLGRFTQRDPMPLDDSTGLYCYGLGNPVISVDPTGKICYRCWRDLEPPLKWWPKRHSFIWCDEGKKGYDKDDPVIGFGSDSICSDFDRKYMKDKKVGKEFNLLCNVLSDKLTSCLKKEIKKDMNKTCFKEYNAATNNCQEYSQHVIDTCKDEIKNKEK